MLKWAYPSLSIWFVIRLFVREFKKKRKRETFSSILSQIWMLTGDKLETATCIAKSSKLVSRGQDIHIFKKVSNRSEAHLELNSFRRKSDCALVILGDSLNVSETQVTWGRGGKGFFFFFPWSFWATL